MLKKIIPVVTLSALLFSACVRDLQCYECIKTTTFTTDNADSLDNIQTAYDKDEVCTRIAGQIERSYIKPKETSILTTDQPFIEYQDLVIPVVDGKVKVTTQTNCTLK